MQDSLEFGQIGMRQIKLDVKSATQQTDVYYVDCIKRKKNGTVSHLCLPSLIDIMKFQHRLAVSFSLFFFS